MEVLNKCREFIFVFISKKTMKNSESFYILYVTERRQHWHEKAYSITRWPWTLTELEGRPLLSDKGVKLIVSVNADGIFRLWYPKLIFPYLGFHKGAHIAKSKSKTWHSRLFRKYLKCSILLQLDLG